MDKRRTFVRLALWTALFEDLHRRPRAMPSRQDIEKGRLVVAQACTTCHTTLGRMLQVHKQTAPQWKDTVYFMISRGAQVMPDEIDAVAAFLAQSSARRGTRWCPRPSGTNAECAASWRRGRGQGAGEQAPPAPDGTRKPD